MQHLPNTLLLILWWISNPNRMDILNWDILGRILTTNWEGTFSKTSIQKILFSSFPAATCRSAASCRSCLQHAKQQNTSLFCPETWAVSRASPESPRHYGAQERWPAPDWSDLGPDQVAGHLETLEKAAETLSGWNFWRRARQTSEGNPNVSKLLNGLQTVFSVITWKVFGGSRGILRGVSGLFSKALGILDYAIINCALFVILLSNSNAT